MKLTKQNKLYLGIAAIGVVGYLVWKQNQEKQNFFGRRRRNMGRPGGGVTSFGKPQLTLDVVDAPAPTGQINSCAVAIGCYKNTSGDILYTCQSIDERPTSKDMGNNNYSKNAKTIINTTTDDCNNLPIGGKAGKSRF
jgi:hypothetical protein